MSTPTDRISVPEWLRRHLAVVIDHLPGNYLAAVGDTFPGSFTKREAIIARLRQDTGNFAQISTYLRDCLHAALPARRLLKSLAEDDLLAALEPLHLQVGTSQLVVALWIDSREAVHQLPTAERFPDILPPAASPSDVGPWEAWVYAHFLHPVGIPHRAPPGLPSPPIDPPPTEDSNEGNEQLRRRLKETQARLRVAQQDAAREKESLIQEHQTEIAALTGQRDAAQTALTQLQTEFQRQLRKETEQAVSAQVRPWLARAIAIDEGIQEAGPEFANLKQAVGKALENQRNADRHAGNLIQIRQELEELEQLREKALLASEATLHPISEWKKLHTRLDEAITKRRTLLDQPPAAPGWVPELAASIASARSPEQLQQTRDQIGSLASCGLISPECVRWLEERARRRTSALTPVTGSGPGPKPTTISDLIHERAPGILLIDVYNWIGCAGSILGVSDQPDQFAESFRKLRPQIRAFARSLPRLDLHLFLDSPESRIESLGSKVRLHWSGGSGPNRADTALLAHLRHLRDAGEAAATFVVTDDQQVCREARGLGVGVEATVAFAKRFLARIAAKGSAGCPPGGGGR